jgi:monovalent cation:proton antiporter-2 (CPA2) family protein
VSAPLLLAAAADGSGPGFLEQAFVYLAAAVCTVPLARRLGLGSVLGYLIAGVVIGPSGLGFLGSATEGTSVLHVAEFGVVMMLFVVGLELEPGRLWRLRGPILGLGGLQVTLTAAALAALAALAGLRWQPALAVGMTLALSSTAIVLQSLAEKGQLRSPAGQSAFAVLLFQDIAVIPMLALFPLLATLPAAGAAGDGAAPAAATWVSGLPGGLQALAVLGAVAAVVLGGRWAVRPAFRAIARTRLREMFTAASLLLVVGIALLMTRVGLSPALGTFLAGVVLATSEFRHELEGDLEPFKGLLLGLFFIAVGSTLDLAYIGANLGRVAAIVAVVLAVKFAVLALLGRGFGLARDQALLLAFALPQVGEFAFVLLAFAEQSRVLDAAATRPLVAAVALSMAVTPLLLLAYERVVQPRVAPARAAPTRASDAADDGSPVLIAGFGGFGSTVGRLLRANAVRPTVLDADGDRVDLLRAMGLDVYYGDASRLDLLRAAGAERARLLVLALDSPERTLEVVRIARTHFPHLTILARAFDWDDAYDLHAAGVTHVYRESLDTALRTGEAALRLLGFRAHQAHRAAQTFRRHDERYQRELTTERADRTMYLSAARERIAELERLLRLDLEARDLDADAGWDAESLREEVRQGALARR